MWSLLLSILFLFVWFKSPNLRSWFWNLTCDFDETVDDDQPEEIVQRQYFPTPQKNEMELYLEKSRRQAEKLGPAIDAQGDAVDEWTSPSLEQFRELHHQSQIGGL